MIHSIFGKEEREVLRSKPPKSLPSAYTDVCMLKRPEGTVMSSLCFLSLPPSASLYEIVDILHPVERAYYQTLQFERRQKSYLLGRYAAKQAIAILCEEKDLRTISIDHGIFNQPIARHPYNQNVQVSITHCDEIGAAIAFPEAHPMGIDIERIHTKHRQVLENQITTKEKALFKTIFCSYEEFLTAMWTVKEGLSKILKTGLTTPFHVFEVSKIDMDGCNIIFEFKNFGQYQAVSFNLGRYILAIVYPKKTDLTIDIHELKKLVAYNNQLPFFE